MTSPSPSLPAPVTGHGIGHPSLLPLAVVLEPSSRAPHPDPAPVVRVRAGAPGVAVLAAAPARLAAQQATQPGPAIPAPRGMVNDFANVIPPDQAARIEALVERSPGEIRRRNRGGDACRTSAAGTWRDIALRSAASGRSAPRRRSASAQRNAGVVILVVPKETSSDGKGHCERAVGPGQRGLHHRRRGGRHPCARRCPSCSSGTTATRSS